MAATLTGVVFPLMAGCFWQAPKARTIKIRNADGISAASWGPKEVRFILRSDTIVRHGYPVECMNEPY